MRQCFVFQAFTIIEIQSSQYRQFDQMRQSLAVQAVTATQFQFAQFPKRQQIDQSRVTDLRMRKVDLLQRGQRAQTG